MPIFVTPFAQLDLIRMPEPLAIRFRYVDVIPREPSGKYQEFV